MTKTIFFTRTQFIDPEIHLRLQKSNLKLVSKIETLFEACLLNVLFQQQKRSPIIFKLTINSLSAESLFLNRVLLKSQKETSSFSDYDHSSYHYQKTNSYKQEEAKPQLSKSIPTLAQTNDLFDIETELPEQLFHEEELFEETVPAVQADIAEIEPELPEMEPELPEGHF